jgi:hypothetical protein
MRKRNFQSAIRVLALASLVGVGVGASGCLPKSNDQRESLNETDPCVMPTERVAGASGDALAFLVDPMVSSGNATLSPLSTRLDLYRSSFSLDHLSGHGVLAGDYVNVRNENTCGGRFLAFNSENQFNYSVKDPRFGEAMAYYYSDSYRARLDQTGYLLPIDSLPVVAHCGKQDNAYFLRGIGEDGDVVQFVCLGDSIATPGASYTDDASVVLHELQHATTVNNYSQTQGLNQLWYDEAGALNESISDFLSLTFLEPMTPSPFDPRSFSRWALGTFFGRFAGDRGSHRCPAYDSDFPNCRGFSLDPASGYSATSNTVSFSYPDGLGWPFSNNYVAPGYARQAFLNSGSKEEIHNNATVMTGGLWEIYEALKPGHGSAGAHRLVTQLTMEAIKRAPKPTSLLISPVTFREFAQQIVNAASLLGLSSPDQALISSALQARGLIGGTQLPEGWAEVGTGSSSAPGIRIADNPVVLKDWLDFWIGAPSSVVSQAASNGRANPGDAIALWFDIKNSSSVTAGGINLKVTALDSRLSFLDEEYNAGFVDSSHAQIQYAKVNGSAVVTALSSANLTFNVPTGNSYFLTNPDYLDSPTTALWLKVSPTATPGTQSTLRVEVLPSNGPAQTLDFTVVIN